MHHPASHGVHLLAPPVYIPKPPLYPPACTTLPRIVRRAVRSPSSLGTHKPGYYTAHTNLMHLPCARGLVTHQTPSLARFAGGIGAGVVQAVQRQGQHDAQPDVYPAQEDGTRSACHALPVVPRSRALDLQSTSPLNPCQPSLRVARMPSESRVSLAVAAAPCLPELGAKRPPCGGGSGDLGARNTLATGRTVPWSTPLHLYTDILLGLDKKALGPSSSPRPSRSGILTGLVLGQAFSLGWSDCPTLPFNCFLVQDSNLARRVQSQCQSTQCFDTFVSI